MKAKEDALAGAIKTILETSDDSKSTITLHYKEIPRYYKKKLMITTSQKCLVRTLETMKEAVAKSQVKIKDLMGHGLTHIRMQRQTL